MNKKILLVEPSYKTKYPPLGLMKISTYHKMKGDAVKFVKGCNANVLYDYWDRIYIATLFTWTWKDAVQTISFYTKSDTLFNAIDRCYVGGILATLLPDEIYNATGVKPVQGLLNTPQKINQDDNIIIDSLAPDYEILRQVENDEFKYAYADAYLGYASRGCIRNCKYCAVKILEPEFKPYIDLAKLISDIKAKSGEKKDLLLMDNNILASPDFDQIIDEIKTAGFVKGATYGPTKKRRVVDFNQGLDARLLTEKKMKRLSEIPIEPLRIAFDDIKFKDVYVKAVRIANKYGQFNMSNYVLYNYKDTPDDFYERLRINIDLNKEFKSDGHKEKTLIYSFPMRYIPLNAKERGVDTGNRAWNKRYLRAIKLILNVTKGPVMPDPKFFCQAFGRNVNEFKCILLMPGEFILNRLKPDWRNIKKYENRLMPYVRKWFNEYRNLSMADMSQLLNVLSSNQKQDIIDAYNDSSKSKISRLLKMHIDAEKLVSKYRG